MNAIELAANKQVPAGRETMSTFHLSPVSLPLSCTQGWTRLWPGDSRRGPGRQPRRRPGQGCRPARDSGGPRCPRPLHG